MDDALIDRAVLERFLDVSEAYLLRPQSSVWVHASEIMATLNAQGFERGPQPVSCADRLEDFCPGSLRLA